MVGYGSITPVAPLVPATPPPGNPEREYFNALRAEATGQGFTEVYNYSFVNEAQLAELGMDPSENVKVLNPISSDQGLLRTSLLPGILRNVRDNARHLERFCLFEIGYEIHSRPSGLPTEVPHLAAAVFHRNGDGAAELLEAKHLAQCLLPGADVRPGEPRTYDHPMRAWEVIWQGESVGRLSELHPKLVTGRAAILDLDLAKTQALPPPAASYQPLTRFPASSFDLTAVTGQRELVGNIAAELAKTVEGYSTSVDYLGQYIGENLGAGRKSISFRVTVQTGHTMSQEEIAAVRQQLIERLRAAGHELTL